MRTRMLGARSAPRLVALLAMIAAAGFLLGREGAPRSSSRAPQMLEASSEGVAVEYPSRSGWRPVRSAAPLSGVTLQEPVALAPRGDPALGGLVAGRSPDSAGAPLPLSLLARVGAGGRADVVVLEGGQALRYALPDGGPGGAPLTVFAMPRGNAQPILALCYAPARAPSRMRACEGIARTLSISGPAGSGGALPLTPDSAYGRLVQAAVGHLTSTERILRGRLARDSRAPTAALIATRLASAVGAVAAALAAVSPPAAAEAAHAALVRSLRGLRDAYRALGEAARAESSSAWVSARGRVAGAEASIGVALTELALLGYA
jgi:hypothetical protein